MRKLKLQVRLCTSESEGNVVAYEDGARLVSDVSREILHPTPPGELGVSFVNRQGGRDKSRPDMSWCGFHGQVSCHIPHMRICRAVRHPVGPRIPFMVSSLSIIATLVCQHADVG